MTILEAQSQHAATLEAKRILWNASQYLYRNQFGDAGRVQAMDMLDRIRRDFIPSRFTDPAYLKAERAVARVERAIRRNVR